MFGLRVARHRASETLKASSQCNKYANVYLLLPCADWYWYATHRCVEKYMYSHVTCDDGRKKNQQKTARNNSNNNNDGVVIVAAVKP